MSNDRAVLLCRAERADDAWQMELERVYGRQAGDARYDQRGIATPTLARLKELFQDEAASLRLSYGGFDS